MSDQEEVKLDALVAEDDSAFDSEAVAKIEATETPPAFASDDWHDYVMRQFRNDELDDGNPYRDALVRVVEKVVGPIVDRQIINYTPPTEANFNTATAHIRLTILVANEFHPLHGKLITEDGIADTNSRNSKPPFHLHPSATSASKAESQAARKALRLRRVVSADEITPEDMVSSDVTFLPEMQITQEQINVIDLLSRRANVSVLDYINAGKHKYAFIEQVSDGTAQQMIQTLNKIQSGKQKSPVAATYDPAWRELNQKRIDNNESNVQSQK